MEISLQISLNREYSGSYFETRGVSKEVFDEFFLGMSLPHPSLTPFLVNQPTFPVYDFMGELKGYAFRPGDKDCKYMNGGFKKIDQLYGIHLAIPAIMEQNSVIITEGYFDVLIPFTHGIRNVVAIFGNTISEQQAAILASYTNNFILALDSDNSGLAGAEKSERVIKRLFPSVNITRKLVYPQKDLADYVQTLGGLDDGQRESEETNI